MPYSPLPSQACQQALQRDRDRAQVACELLEGAMSKANMAVLKVEKALVVGLMAQGESDAGSRAKVGGCVMGGGGVEERLAC